MNLKMIDRLIDASKKFHGEYDVSKIEVTNIYSLSNGVSLSTLTNDYEVNITFKKLEEKQDDTTV